MMHSHLKKIIDSILTLTNKENDLIGQAFEMVEISAKTTMTKIGDVETKMYFIIKGILRLYCTNTKDEDTTIFLFSENNFASCYESFLNETHSEQGLETLEDCTLLCINRANFEKLHDLVPRMNSLTRRIADLRFINGQKVFMSHITRSPEQRYLDFERDHGKMLLRVPLNIIASFLGMTPVSLSRIRNRVLTK